MNTIISAAIATLSLLSFSGSAQASWLSEGAKAIGLPLPSLHPQPSPTSCLSVVIQKDRATLVNNTGGVVNFNWRQGNRSWAPLVLADGMQQPLEGGINAGRCGGAEPISIRFDNGKGAQVEYRIGNNKRYSFQWHNGALDVFTED